MNHEFAETPLISVVMPVYNSDAYLAEAIESILAQSYPQFEFIIIDDCSTDGSAEIIRNYARRDERIRPLYLAHKGAGGAANAGIAAARGDLIARMDADDIALPERFATQIAWMRRTGVDICGSCIKTFGAENRLMWFPESHEAICVEMLFRSALMQPTVMMRTDIAKKHPYNESLYFEDYELWTRLALGYRMGNVPEVLLKYRTHLQQRHIQKAADVRNELKRYCQVYYRSMFPAASMEEAAAIACLAGNEPMGSLRELELAGNILVRLATVNDNFLRGRLAQRWRAACRRSACLGFQTYSICQKIRRRLGDGRNRSASVWLAFASLLRLGSGSAMESTARWILRRIRS